MFRAWMRMFWNKGTADPGRYSIHRGSGRVGTSRHAVLRHKFSSVFQTRMRVSPKIASSLWC